jgi:hypothetical protein
VIPGAEIPQKTICQSKSTTGACMFSDGGYELRQLQPRRPAAVGHSACLGGGASMLDYESFNRRNNQ